MPVGTKVGGGGGPTANKKSSGLTSNKNLSAAAVAEEEKRAALNLKQEDGGQSSSSSSNSSSTGSGSSSSSSGNDSSSSGDSDDSSTSSDAESEDEGDSSSTSSPKKNTQGQAGGPTTTTTTSNTSKLQNKNKTGVIPRRSSRSCSSSHSRASSVASSVSSATSSPIKTTPAAATPGARNTKKATSTTAIKKTPSKPTTTKTSKDKKATAVVPVKTPITNNKASTSVNNKSTSQKKNKKLEGVVEDKKSAAAPSTTTPTTKSKLVKSGSVTNTRTIKPLINTAPTPKKKTAAASKVTATTPTTTKSKSTTIAANKVVKTPPPLTIKSKKQVIAQGVKKRTPPQKATKLKESLAKEKQQGSEAAVVSAVVSTTTGPSTPIASRTRHQSSCSSSTASTSSANSSSEAEDDEPNDAEESSVADSSPTKQSKAGGDGSRSSSIGNTNNNNKGATNMIRNKKAAAVVASIGNKKKKVIERKVMKKKQTVVRNLSAVDLLSSADETDSKDNEGKGRKQPHQRRPVTRRQKLGNKKTIPTTTVFNQSLLLAASNLTNSSPTGTPKKSSGATISSLTIAAGAASTSSTSAMDLPLTLLPSSSIINRRSTSNSSANSSGSESGGRMARSFPMSTLTTQSTLSSKNKYLSTWDSDFSDDNFNQHLSQSAAVNFIRVPAKTSNKPRTFDFSLLDSEAYEPPRCPFPSCDSSGHLSGQYRDHNFLSCCPRFHGFESQECTENEQERKPREAERSRYRNVLSTPGKKPPKQTKDTKEWLDRMKDLKGVHTKDGLVSEYDALLWKDSLAIAADRIEREQTEGISTQGIYYRSTMAVVMGRFEMKCWCASPYPEPLSQNRRLFVCEFCLKPVGSGTVLRRHCAKCVWRHPPGDEIYRKDRLSVWEVDGKKQKTYCQNLCLLAKCFLDHKTLYLDVDPFLFYVMTLADSQGCHIVGYFSKEKNSFLNYNVSCLLTLPPYQRQGFGRLLIDFSYLLTRVENKVGSPEKPLSDLGLISYRSYWKDAVLRRLCACASRDINIKDLSIELGVSTADLISTLQYLGMLKYWKGKHLVLKKQDVLEEYLERVRRRGNEQRQIDSSCLRWKPYQPPPDENSSSEKS